ncbi:C2H2 type zinc-finger (2 copies) domain containing protein [Amanita muscaria]
MADQPLFTCLSCNMAFLSADEQSMFFSSSLLFSIEDAQGLHYRSDHHRYNMKRRVAGLPPVSASVFNDKVLERRQESAVQLAPRDFACTDCNKVYTTENAYKSHLSSKKHKENALNPRSSDPPLKLPAAETTLTDVAQRLADTTLSEDGPADEVDEKIAAARARLSLSDCLFCSTTSASLDENLSHMSLSHSFFIPDAEYIVDLPGLVVYLGEKAAVGNVCMYCNAKSRDFRTLEAVRKHMIDKGHCKIAYDTEDDRLEISDFYDFTNSYPTNEKRKQSNDDESAEEWEDVQGDDALDADEVVELEESSDDGIPENSITYGDTEYELVLPSGTRVGHRSLKRYYAQSFRFSIKDRAQDPRAAMLRQLIGDKNAALVPRKGGYGAFGSGMDVVKARNPGEARHAGRHVREHRDQKRREEFKTKVGFKHNHQKHYRDPLLQ